MGLFEGKALLKHQVPISVFLLAARCWDHWVGKGRKEDVQSREIQQARDLTIYQWSTKPDISFKVHKKKKLYMAKTSWGKKYREDVQRNHGDWAIILKYVESSLLFIPEFAMFNHNRLEAL